MGFLNRLVEIGAAPATPVTSAGAADAFLAIDFETASSSRASACAVGWSRFENGAEAQSGTTLIDPGLEPGEWDGFNISIHGIEPADVVGAPSFAEVWEHVSGVSAGSPLVAHYAPFDIGVVRAELWRAGIQPVPFRYTCSAAMARAVWPEMLSVSLPIVAAELGIELNHHEAGSDARASGQVLLAGLDALGVDTIDEAFTATGGRRWGEVRSDLSWVGSTRDGHPLRAKQMSATRDDFDEDHPLYGQVVVFTGALHSMTRREAFQLVLNVGGQPGDGVTKHTNVLVVGEQDIHKLAAGQTMSSKQRKAADLRVKGLNIQLVGESDFLRML